MRSSIVAILLLCRLNDARRVRPEQQTRSFGMEQEKTSAISDSELHSGIYKPSRLKTLGVLGMAGMAQGLTVGAMPNPGAVMIGDRPTVGQPHGLVTQSRLRNQGRVRAPVLMNHDIGHTNISDGGLFPDLFAGSESNHNLDSVLDPALVEPVQIEQLSPLSHFSHAKDIYELASGELLLLMKGSGDSSPLVQEFEALQAIERVGINVAPHRMVQVEHPVTGATVWGLIEERILGEFVNVANDAKTADKLFALVSSNPEAAQNLKTDIDVILNSFNSGFQITDLQGFVQPDGHFVVIDPGPYGVGNIFAGKYIGQSEMVPLGKKGTLDVKLQTTMMRLMKVVQMLDKLA